MGSLISILTAVLAESAIFDEFGIQNNQIFRLIFWQIVGGFLGGEP